MSAANKISEASAEPFSDRREPIKVSTANKYAVIVAGGIGTRMGSDMPKQFLLLAGKPLLMHAISAFHQAGPDIRIVVVLPIEWIEKWRGLCQEYRFTETHSLIGGGETRFHSVRNGLNALEGPGLVAVHDGARPLIRPETILRLFDEAGLHSSAIPVVSPSDSLRWQDESGNRVIDRNFVKVIQTPQVFDLHKLKAAYVHEYENSFTDDATVWEKSGHAVHLTEGQTDNIKVTTADDLIFAEGILRRKGGFRDSRTNSEF